MIFDQRPKAASAGSNHVTLNVPVGAILKKVNATNGTKFWQKISLQLVEQPEGLGRTLSLINNIPQCGNRDVTWDGEIKIDSPFIYVDGFFRNCDADDALTLTIGYEMPPAQPRRWW